MTTYRYDRTEPDFSSAMRKVFDGALFLDDDGNLAQRRQDRDTRLKQVAGAINVLNAHLLALKRQAKIDRAKIRDVATLVANRRAEARWLREFDLRRARTARAPSAARERWRDYLDAERHNVEGCLPSPAREGDLLSRIWRRAWSVRGDLETRFGKALRDALKDGRKPIKSAAEAFCEWVVANGAWADAELAYETELRRIEESNAKKLLRDTRACIGACDHKYARGTPENESCVRYCVGAEIDEEIPF